MHSLKKLVYCMISITAISVVQFKAVCHKPVAVLMLEYIYFDLSVFGEEKGGKGEFIERLYQLP